MKKLSTGADSTLRNYLNLTETVFGKESPQTKYLLTKAETDGLDAEVIADERQMIQLLISLS